MFRPVHGPIQKCAEESCRSEEEGGGAAWPARHTIRYCKILIFDLYDTVLKSVGYRIVKGTKWSALTSKTD